MPTTDVGAYYLAYLACLPVTLAAIARSQATQPLLAESDQSTEASPYLRRVTAAQHVVVDGAAVAAGLIGPPAIVLLLQDDYAGATQLIPWLAAGTCLYGLYLMPTNAIALVAGKTRHLWLITVLAAGLNIGLNLILVPRIGTAAAAINTTIGYGLLLIGVFLYMRRVCEPPIPHDWKRIGMGALVMGVPSVIAAAVIPPNSGVGLAVRTAVIMVATVALLIGPFRSEARSAWRAIPPVKANGRS